MSGLDLTSLATPEGEKLLEQYFGMGHTEVAIKSRNAVLATAIKYLDRARTKLPNWYINKTLIDSQLFEQCSSEATANAKFRGIDGETALDLTCGLGVDSWALSKNFKRVTTVEINETKVKLAKYNFNKLNALNIEVQNTSAEEFTEFSINKNLKFDLIYIDPSRITRNEKGEILKVYSLEDSSPNIMELLPKLKLLSNQIIIKLSPLFDIEECYRIFGKEIEIEIIATTTECKEVLVKISDSKKTEIQTIKHTIVRGEDNEKSYVLRYSQHTQNKNINNLEAKYIYLPNVAFYKSRCLENYIKGLTENYKISNYIFTEQIILQPFEGQCFKIIDSMQYSPKLIKKRLSLLSIQRATIYMKGFNYTQQQIIKDLKIKEGKDAHLIFTTYNQKQMMFIVEPQNNRI